MKTAYVAYEYHSSGNPNGAAGMRFYRDIVKKIAELKHVRKICELGCGDGYFANYLAGLGYEVTGVDLSESGIRIARENYGKNCKFMQAEINKTLPQFLEEQNFDLIVSVEVISHLYRPADLIEAAQVLLKDGGSLLLTAPYHGYVKNLVLSLVGKMDRHFEVLYEGEWIKFFSVKTMTALLQRHQFQSIRWSFFGRIPWLWKSMIFLAKKAG